MPVIHFNHSGAGLPDADTTQAIIAQLLAEQDLGPMEAALLVSNEREEAYDNAAQLLNCRRDQIAFGTGHGQLYNDIVSAIPLNKSDLILVSRQEWYGNIDTLQRAANLTGAKLSIMASDETTAVDVAALKETLSPDVRVVALTWIGASGALINPAKEIGQAIRDSGSNAFFIIDASQVLGQIPVDVQTLCCDALISCGRKFLRGPRGTALAYVSERLLKEISHSLPVKGTIQSRVDVRTFEPGEQSVALRLGLKVAIQKTLEGGVAQAQLVIQAKADLLRNSLNAIRGLNILDLGAYKAALVTFTIDGIACAEVKARLATKGISIGMHGKDYTPYDLEFRGIPQILRASVHLSTTDDEIATFINAIRAIVEIELTETGKPG